MSSSCHRISLQKLHPEPRALFGDQMVSALRSLCDFVKKKGLSFVIIQMYQST